MNFPQTSFADFEFFLSLSREEYCLVYAQDLQKYNSHSQS